MQSLHLPQNKAVIAISIAFIACAGCVMLTPPERWIAGCFLSIILAWAALIDIDSMILPDLLTFPLLLAGIANAAFEQKPGLLNAVVGATAGYFIFIGIGYVFSRILGRSALGKGDAKLLSSSGAWLGWEWLPYVTLIASCSALLVYAGIALSLGQKLKRGRIAFGPYLALALVIAWLFINTEAPLIPYPAEMLPSI